MWERHPTSVLHIKRETDDTREIDTGALLAANRLEDPHEIY